MPIKFKSLFKTAFIKISVWICPLTKILIFPELANLAAMGAVLFSSASFIISYLEISHFKFSAHFFISIFSPIKIGSIKFKPTAILVDSITNSFPALTMAVLTVPFNFASLSKFSGQIIFLSDSI